VGPLRASCFCLWSSFTDSNPMAILHDGVARTRAFEPLALAAAALLLAGNFVPPRRSDAQGLVLRQHNSLMVSGGLIAFAMAVVGVKHSCMPLSSRP